MKQRRLSLALAGAASVVFLVGTSVAAPPPPAPAQEGQAYVYRVPAPLGQKAQDLLARGFDVLEQRDGDDLFVLGSKDVHTKLAEAGFYEKFQRGEKPNAGWVSPTDFEPKPLSPESADDDR